MAMNMEEALFDKVRNLSPERQREVLDFVEFLQQRSVPKKPGMSLYGIWSHLDVNAEDIDEIRREMWASFPRDDI